MKKSYFFKNKVKSIICFAVFSMFLFVSSCYAQMYYYYPTGGGTITSSGGNVFNVGTGTQLTVNVPMCITGNTNPKNATNFNLSWYVNTVNSNTGGTFVSGGTQSTGTNFNALYSLAISNSTPGVYYYYAVSNGGNASVCSGTNSMTSSVFQVTVNGPATHLNFDGTNDHVTIPATAINDLSQGTIEAWVYLNSLNQQTICAKQSDFENSYAILAVGGGQSDQGAPLPGEVNYQSINGSIIKSTTFLQTGQWYHLAITFTNTQAKLYINGTLNNTVNADFSIPNDVTVTATTIGAWLGSGGGQYFNGNIDEFRVWNVALSATDIANTMNCEAMSQPELVTYYKFNQGFDYVSNTSVTTLTDSAGSNTGTLTNFALTGATSNWKAGSTITTGNTCTVLETETFNSILEVIVYPNPSTGIFNIAIQEDANITVNDMLGKVIYTNKVKAGNNTIDISNYQSGIYLLSVTTENGSVTKKLIKE